MTASIIYFVALVVTIVICRGRAFGRFTSLAELVMLTGVVPTSTSAYSPVTAACKPQLFFLTLTLHFLARLPE